MKAQEHLSFLCSSSKFALVMLLPVVLGLAGCGATQTNPPPAEKPTVSVSASPASIPAGSSSTLTVTAANATSVTIKGSDGSSYTLAANGGTQAVKPTATTTYTATATGTGGTATATATVTVAASGPAPTVTIAADPTSIASGSSSTLTVTATNATSVTVAGSDGSSYTLAAAGGTQAVKPTATTTYTATATGAGGAVTATATVTVSANPAPTVTIVADPTSVPAGGSSTLSVTAAYATSVVVTAPGGVSYTLAVTGGTQAVTPAATTTYTATATGAGGTTTATATLTVTPAATVQSINHVIFMMQENRTFDSYFGMLNPYRENPDGNGVCPNNAAGVPQCWNIGDDGKTYNVDGIDDKLDTKNESDEGVEIPLFKFRSTCIDDDSSAWLSSYGDANRYDFLTDRPIKMDGFVHTAQGFAYACILSGTCSGAYTDTGGVRAMGYYDQDYLNYYYYMAAQFAVSDRWFSPIASKSTPNRVATYTGGTTTGLVYDPGYDDHLGGVAATPIFEALDKANVSWKVYYTYTNGECTDADDCGAGAASYPALDVDYIYYDTRYLYPRPGGATCNPPTVESITVGDASNYYCVDPNHIAPLATYFSDVANGTLASVSFIEPGYGHNDEHPGSYQPILLGQTEVAKVVNAFMASPSWSDSVFFFSYDEGGGPYDHVPPIPGHSNDFTDVTYQGQPFKANYPDIGPITVNPDEYPPCLPADGIVTAHCDLHPSDPGAHAGDAAKVDGFAAQIGFRLPNFVVSPFTRRHYVSHIPMDHTAVIKFIENRFIGPTAHLTARDAAQPDLLDFFDFNGVPWATPPTPPAPFQQPAGVELCTPANLGP